MSGQGTGGQAWMVSRLQERAAYSARRAADIRAGRFRGRHPSGNAAHAAALDQVARECRERAASIQERGER